jgi:hypothetical protein
MSPNSWRFCSTNITQSVGKPMTRGLAAALGLALAATLAGGALAQSPWPAAPAQSAAPSGGQAATGQAAPWPSSSPQQPAQPWPTSPQQSSFPAGPAGPAGSVFGAPQAAQPPAQCQSFAKLRDDASQKANLVSEIGKKHGDRAAMCAAVTRFYDAEQKVVAFLETNKVTCNVPDQAIQQSKVIHANTQKFKDNVCAEGPKPKIPTLSDAISTTPVDTQKNTHTGPGTFDTLTGNPLNNR